MTLHRTDLLPRFGAGYRGARPGVIVAALERVLLESMLSIGFNAQARLLQARQGASAAGWSAAEEAAQRAAKAIASLT